MKPIKKVIVLTVFILSIFNLNVYAKEDRDMFDTIKEYAYTNYKANDLFETKIEVIHKGKDIEDIISEKTEEKYEAVKDKGVYSDKSDITPLNNSGSKYTNKEYYYLGTNDFTRLNTAEKDTLLNKWSAINPAYEKYDDKGEDNITIIATAYTSAAEENGGYEGMNAIGGSLGPGCIAAPKDIKFQTKIRISGLGTFNVEDRGSAIVRVDENTIRVDVWMGSYKEAMNFGKRIYSGRIMNLK